MGANKQEPPSLRDIEARLRKLRGELEQGAGRGAPRPSRLGQALSVAVEMIAAVLVGGGIGWLLDRWLGTRPWLLVVFLIIGIAAGVLNAYRASRRMGIESEEGNNAPGGGKPPEGTE